MGDQFWHPEGVQVKAPNSRILISPLQWTAEGYMCRFHQAQHSKAWQELESIERAFARQLPQIVQHTNKKRNPINRHKKATLKPRAQTWNTTIQARYPCSTSRHKLLKGACVSKRASHEKLRPSAGSESVSPMQSKKLWSENLGFGAKSASGMPGKGPRLGPRSMCTDFQPGRPILRLFRAAFRTPCDCIGSIIRMLPKPRMQ